MKIAFLNIYQGLVDRGAETFVKEVSGLLSKKHEVVVLSGNKLPRARWPVIWRFFIDPQGLHILWWTVTKIPELWKKKFDVIIPLNGGWQPAVVRIVTWLYGGKIIISGQSGMGWDDRNNLWSFPDVFIALSTPTQRWAKRANPFVRVKYIPNGVDLSSFNPAGRKLNFDLSRPIILCVAALTKNKRFGLIIEAVSKMDKGNLMLVGDGPDRQCLEELCSELLGGRFHFTGAKPYKDLPEIYRSVDLFTLPSVSFQSFEIVLVEAMASGLAVVANDDPIRREIVGAAGLYVDPTNSNKYAEALQKALDTKWGNKPRRQAEKFSWNRISEQYEKLFKSL